MQPWGCTPLPPLANFWKLISLLTRGLILGAVIWTNESSPLAWPCHHFKNQFWNSWNPHLHYYHCQLCDAKNYSTRTLKVHMNKIHARLYQMHRQAEWGIDGIWLAHTHRFVCVDRQYWIYITHHKSVIYVGQLSDSPSFKMKVWRKTTALNKLSRTGFLLMLIDLIGHLYYH